MRQRYLLLLAVLLLLTLGVGVAWWISKQASEPVTLEPDRPVAVVNPAELRIDSVLDSYVQDGEGCMILSYVYTIKYTGVVPVEDVVITSRFTNHYAGKFSITSVVNPAGDLPLNPGFDGLNNTSLLLSGATLQPGTHTSIRLTVRLCGYRPDVDFVNYVYITGQQQRGSSSSGTKSSATTTSTPRPTPSPDPMPIPGPTTPPPSSGGEGENLSDSDQVTFRLPVGGSPGEVVPPPQIIDVGGGKDRY